VAIRLAEFRSQARTAAAGGEDVATVDLRGQVQPGGVVAGLEAARAGVGGHVLDGDSREAAGHGAGKPVRRPGVRAVAGGAGCTSSGTSIAKPYPPGGPPSAWMARAASARAVVPAGARMFTLGPSAVRPSWVGMTCAPAACADQQARAGRRMEACSYCCCGWRSAD
jgi:hypothetical protein